MPLHFQLILASPGQFRGIRVNKTVGLQPSLTNFPPVQRLANDFIAIGAQASKTEVRGGEESVFWDPGYQRTDHGQRKIIGYKEKASPSHTLSSNTVTYPNLVVFLCRIGKIFIQTRSRSNDYVTVLRRLKNTA